MVEFRTKTTTGPKEKKWLVQWTDTDEGLPRVTLFSSKKAAASYVERIKRTKDVGAVWVVPMTVDSATSKELDMYNAMSEDD